MRARVTNTNRTCYIALFIITSSINRLLRIQLPPIILADLWKQSSISTGLRGHVWKLRLVYLIGFVCFFILRGSLIVVLLSLVFNPHDFEVFEKRSTSYSSTWNITTPTLITYMYPRPRPAFCRLPLELTMFWTVTTGVRHYGSYRPFSRPNTVA